VRLPFFYGWVVVGVAFVTMGVGVNARTAFSLLFPPILDEFGWERGLTAGAFAVGFIISALGAPLLGALMDTKGPRWMLGIGVCLVGGGMALAPLVTRPWHLYLTLGFLVSGGSVALAYSGHALFLPNWFVRRRGLATGIAFSGVGIGSIVMFPWLQSLIVGRGWRTACVAVAILVFALFPLILLQRRRPQDLGLVPDGDTAAHAADAARRHPANVVDPAWASVEWTLPRAIRTARFWWLAVGFFAGLWAWYAVQVHQTRYLIDIGFPPKTAALALGLVPFMGIAGQIALGHLSDRLGREAGWTLGAGGFALCYVILLVMRDHPTPAMLYAMVVAQGLLGYGVASVFAAIPAEIFQGRRYATIFGALNTAAVSGGGFAPWVTGAIYDRTGSYTAGWWLAIGFCAVSIVCIWAAAPRKVRAVAGRVGRGRKTIDAREASR
jgi:MFS family permease